MGRKLFFSAAITISFFAIGFVAGVSVIGKSTYRCFSQKNSVGGLLSGPDQLKRSLTYQETTYLNHLGSYLDIQGLPFPKTINNSPVLQALTELNIRLNNHASGGSSSPDTTPALENLAYPILISPSPAHVTLPKLNRYRYSITNNGKKDITGPIFYQAYLWTTAEDLIRTSGFGAIPDEMKRAIALWRFICRNRYHFYPVTEEEEEHDIIKYLAVYGYGFCDDTARILALLAEMTGLKSRIWWLDGHVVSEIYVKGKWRMFDADLQVFFHPKNRSEDAYSVEELSRNKSCFKFCTKEPSTYSDSTETNDYIPFFTNPANNKMEDLGYARASHKIQYSLRIGESIVFTNYNWGRYYLGKYPYPVPLYQYRMRIKVKPKSSFSISELKIKSVFQFAKLALLYLHAGKNEIRVFHPNPATMHYDGLSAAVILEN